MVSEQTRRASDALRAGYDDLAWLRSHPEIQHDYRGQWIVVRDRKVIAHFKAGDPLSGSTGNHSFPGASIFYIPTDEELTGIRII
jgi:hypothetical protein